MLDNLTHALQLMWIEPVQGHSFLTCNLPEPCFLIETSDTELNGIHWSRIERFHIWSLELVTEAERSSREDGETRRGARAIVLLRYLPINQLNSPVVPYTHTQTHTQRYIYIYHWTKKLICSNLRLSKDVTVKYDSKSGANVVKTITH